MCAEAFKPDAQFMVIRGNIMSKYPVASSDNTRTGALAGTVLTDEAVSMGARHLVVISSDNR